MTTCPTCGAVKQPNQIRAMREAHGMTQQDLAKESGVSLRTVRNLEAGVFRGRWTTHRKLLGAFGMTWDERSQVWPQG